MFICTTNFENKIVILHFIVQIFTSHIYKSFDKIDTILNSKWNERHRQWYIVISWNNTKVCMILYLLKMFKTKLVFGSQLLSTSICLLPANLYLNKFAIRIIAKYSLYQQCRSQDNRKPIVQISGKIIAKKVWTIKSG